MNWIIYFGLLVVLATAVVVLRYWQQVHRSAAEVESRIRPVDLECFQALQRSLDARCLASLPATQVRAIRRRLGWGAMDYLWRVHRNASAYAQLGQLAARAADAELAAAGRALAQQAVLARMQSLSALARTTTILLFPATQTSAAWMPQYQRMQQPFDRLQALYAAKAA
jgi:hypothetical protein